MDLLMCLLLIPILILPMGVPAIVVKLDSKGPVLFRQSVWARITSSLKKRLDRTDNMKKTKIPI
ncbi:MAG: hypothetical protein ACI4HJ_04365 [Ruminococcus sp.]